MCSTVATHQPPGATCRPLKTDGNISTGHNLTIQSLIASHLMYAPLVARTEGVKSSCVQLDTLRCCESRSRMFVLRISVKLRQGQWSCGCVRLDMPRLHSATPDRTRPNSNALDCTRLHSTVGLPFRHYGSITVNDEKEHKNNHHSLQYSIRGPSWIVARCERSGRL